LADIPPVPTAAAAGQSPVAEATTTTESEPKLFCQAEPAYKLRSEFPENLRITARCNHHTIMCTSCMFEHLSTQIGEDGATGEFGLVRTQSTGTKMDVTDLDCGGAGCNARLNRREVSRHTRAGTFTR
jgi:hypothetical protein